MNPPSQPHIASLDDLDSARNDLDSARVLLVAARQVCVTDPDLANDLILKARAKLRFVVEDTLRS